MNQESIGIGAGYRNEPGLRDFINLGERQISSKPQPLPLASSRPLTEYIDLALTKSVESLMQQVVALECKLLPVTFGGVLQNSVLSQSGPHQNIEISPASEVRTKLKGVENELNELSRRLMNLTAALDI